MKEAFIIFLYIIFSSSSSLADNKKITVEEVENIFFSRLSHRDFWGSVEFFKTELTGKTYEEKKVIYAKREQRENEEWYKKRVEARGVASCVFRWQGGVEKRNQCYGKVIRAVFSYSEKSKKRRPGDIFYTLLIIENIITESEKFERFVRHIRYKEGIQPDKQLDKPVLGMKCEKDYDGKIWKSCVAWKKSYSKKFMKFKQDPSNEKVLGKALKKYITDIRMITDIREKIGTGNYVLLGDMMNAAVSDVKKNNVPPELVKRRALLKKYSLNLQKIKKNLNEDNYKSIDKDISKLSKSYEDLTSLNSATNEALVNIDGAVNTLFNTNELIQNTTLNAKDNVEERLLAQSSITFMEFLIDSILTTIPEKYYAETQGLPKDFFTESELIELENIIANMKNKNKEIKSVELDKSMDVIKKHINTSEVLKILNNLGIENDLDEEITLNKASKIAIKQVRDNLDKDILKSVSKLVDNMDKNEMSDLAKEVSTIASEIASNPAVKDASTSILDKKFGQIKLGTLVHACRSGRSVGGMC